jgi:hypothetical protein
MATTVPPYAIVYGPDANCTLDICPIDASVYGYRPDIVTNSVFVGFYAVCGILHTYLGFRFQKWFFTGCMVISCTSIVIGYIGRVLMCSNPWDFTGFIIQISKYNIAIMSSINMSILTDLPSLCWSRTDLLLCGNLRHACFNRRNSRCLVVSL